MDDVLSNLLRNRSSSPVGYSPPGPQEREYIHDQARGCQDWRFECVESDAGGLPLDSDRYTILLKSGSMVTSELR